MTAHYEEYEADYYRRHPNEHRISIDFMSDDDDDDERWWY